MTNDATFSVPPGNSGAQKRLPEWFRIDLGLSGQFRKVQRQVGELGLHTVCQSARCPNRNECWNAGTATFLILGNRCTRGCRFCSVPKGAPSAPDQSEPARIAQAVSSLSLNYAVITSVTRDDLPDGGAGIFAATIREVRSAVSACRVEVLIPDLGGSEEALAVVVNAGPDVLGHNLETVPSLYSAVRPRAGYERSLQLLERARKSGSVTKSGIMVGLGETRSELSALFSDLRSVGCEILTIGQYLQPGREHLQVKKLYHPDEFASLQREADAMGFRRVVSGPLVRSSYRAEQHSRQAWNRETTECRIKRS